MLIDNKLKYFFNEDLAGQGTGALNSEVIDHGDIGDSDLADGRQMFLNIHVEGDILSGGAATVAFKLQDSADGSTFADTDVSYAAVGKADLVAGWKKRVTLPSGLRQHTRLVATVGTAALTGGQISAFITES